MSTPSDDHEWPDMVEDCQAQESKLTNWERDFLDDIEAKLSRAERLTDSQRDKLDEIWERVTA